MLITPLFIVAAKQCCTERRAFVVKGPRSGEGTELGELTETGRIGISCHMTPRGRSFEGRGSFISLSSFAQGLAGHWSGSGEQLLMQHLLYTRIYL